MEDNYEEHVQAVKELSLAEESYRIGDYEDAMAHIERSLELDNTLGRTYEIKGMVNFFKGNIEGCRNDLERCMEMKGTYPEAEMALESMDSDDWPDGEGLQNDVSRNLILGQVFLSRRMWIPAALCFRAAERHLELDWKTYSILGFIYREMGMLEPALKYYEMSSSLDDAPDEVEFDRAVVLIKLGRLEEAEEVLRYLLDIMDEIAPIWNNLGTVLEAQGKKDEAMEAYDKAIDLKDDYYPALYSKGRLLQQLGKMKEAKKILDKALDIEGRVYDLDDVTRGDERRKDGKVHAKEIMLEKEK